MRAIRPTPLLVSFAASHAAITSSVEVDDFCICMVRVMLWWSVYVPALAMVNGLKGRVLILDIDRICVSCGSDGGERVRSHSGRDIGVTIVVCIHSMMFGIPVIGQGGLGGGA